MEGKIHRKHPKLNRPNYGEFHRNEWAIIGAPSGEIQNLCSTIIEALGQHYRFAFVDANHAAGDETQSPPSNTYLSYTNKINFHRFDRLGKLSPFQQRMNFLDCDAVLVDGNHFRAKKQIVILDPSMRESLSRKLDQLTDVALIIRNKDQQTPYDFLQQHLQDKDIPILDLENQSAIINWLKDNISNNIPSLNGLVLVGGKSQRMGQDKALLQYYDEPQYLRTAKLFQLHTSKNYLSLRKDQYLDTDLAVIHDSFDGLGPFGAICSAFRENPNTAWFVLACDLPLLDETAINQLVEARDASRLATAFYNKATGWPDPLVTIWEPRAYPIILQFLAQGYACPRKVLINSDVKVIEPGNEMILKNANKPEERDEILDLLTN